MHVSHVEYERLVNTGNYSHEKYNLVVEIKEGEEPQEAFNMAKRYVDSNVAKRQKELFGYEAGEYEEGEEEI